MAGLEAIFNLMGVVTIKTCFNMAVERVFLLWLFVYCCAEYVDPDRIAEESGYLKREHSLGRPFQGRGTEVL